MQNAKNNSIKYYSILWLVVFIWGIVPLVTKYAYENCFSPVISTLIVNLVAVFALLLLTRKKLKLLSKKYLFVAIPSGVSLALANLLQKIGLQYTTPSKYAFLENLSCVVIPILVFIFTRKKQSFLKIFSSILCLLGAFFLSGVEFSSSSLTFGKGEILCALAGLLYGVNISVIGVFAKKLEPDLCVLCQNVISLPFNILALILFGFVPVGGEVLEQTRFNFGFVSIILILFISLISNVLCWQMRTYVSQKIDPTVIGVIMPFSAVITLISSVIFKMETMTLNLVLGAVINLFAVLLSTYSDIKEKKQSHIT